MKFLSEAALEDFIEAVEERRQRLEQEPVSDWQVKEVCRLVLEANTLNRLLRLCEPMQCPECWREIEE